MVTAFSTAQKLDWAGWLLGIGGAAISGGSSAIGGGFGSIIADPEHFNVVQGGFKHVLVVMGIAFSVSAIISLAKFLQTHPVPDQLQQALQTAAIESDKAVVQASKAADAVADAQAAVPDPKK
jgi:hypothetical protein